MRTELEPGTVLAEIRYTATVIVPDDTDTDVYGDQCERGYGATMFTGWYDPDWSRWDVFESREESAVDEITAEEVEDRGTLEDAILSVIRDRIGALDSWDGETAYAADEERDYRTGVTVMATAHVELMANVCDYAGCNKPASPIDSTFCAWHHDNEGTPE
jgi:hypothetical protein